MGAEGTSYRNGTKGSSGTPPVRPANGSNGGKKANPSPGDGSLKKTKFEGRVDGLKGHVYDITGYKSQDLFEKTTKEIVDHIRTLPQKYSYDAAEYIRTLMEPDWKEERPEKPRPSKDDKGQEVDVTDEELEDYEADLDEWKAKRKHVNINLKTAFGVVWSQCSDTIRTKVEKASSFEDMQRSGSVIQLLKAIRSTMMDYQDHKDINQSHGEILRKFYSMYQDKRSTLQEHRDRFDALVAQVEYLGADVGHNPKAVAEILKTIATNPLKPTAEEQDIARRHAKEEFLAAYLILTADRTKYGAVVERLENDKLLGRGEWPKSRNEAFDLLCEYKNDPRNNTLKPATTGMAFTTLGGLVESDTDEEDNDDVKVSFSFLQHTFANVDDPDADDHGPLIPKWWILLDNQSTVNVFCNGKMLNNIRESDKGESIAIATNAGVTLTSMVGDLAGYGTVWYYPGGIANILSFANVAKRWAITIEQDKRSQPMFIVHKPGGKDRRFIQSDRGLYYLDASKSRGKEVTLVNTVEENKSRYSKRDYSRACLARKLQQRIGRPSTSHFIDIVSKGQIPNCPITSQDIRNAEAIFGPEVGCLKGKTVWRKGDPATGATTDIPVAIPDKYRTVVVSIDIMYVNGLAFLVTMSHHIKFTTCEYLQSCSDKVLSKSLGQVRGLYSRRGFTITRMHGDGRFDSLRHADALNGIAMDTTSRDEHDPDIERNIRTLKDRVRSTYHTLPFNKCLPNRIVIELVYTCVFWLNCFHPSGGVSATTSPRTLMTGQAIDYAQHCQLEFGEYVQTHEQHDNSMHARTTGALALRPSGNSRGGYYFHSLNTGRVLHRNRWTALPMPNEVIDHVIAMGRGQNAASGLAFGDIDNQLNGDAVGDFDTGGDESQSDDMPMDNDIFLIGEETTPSGDATDDPTVVTSNVRGQDEAEQVVHLPSNVSDEAAEVETRQDSRGLPEDDAESWDAGNDVETTGAENLSEGMDNPWPTNGVAEEIDSMDDAALESSLTDHVTDEFQSRYNLRPRKQQDYNKPDVTHRLPRSAIKPDISLVTIGNGARLEREWVMLCFEHAYVTAQYTMKRGLKEFGERGMDAVMKEMKQLHDRRVMFPKDARRLSRQERKDSLNYLMFLKEKRSGDVKGRGCADGRKQRIYKIKEETSSPTVTTQSFFISSTMDAAEGRDVAFVDVPGAFMHARMPPGEVVHIKLKGEMAMLLVKIDPSLYKTYVVKERGEPVIYAQLEKALYGQLEAALLFWKLLTKQLCDSWGFVRNEYDWCVVNKDINGEQCTILWHVDDLKISHKDPQVVTKIINDLDLVYGQEVVNGKRAALTVSRGKVHEYLGMKIDFSKSGKCIISMKDYINEMLGELSDDMEGTAVTPAANHLFRINPYGVKLKAEQADMFHHLVAKLLYLSMRARPDIQTAVSFLCTRVQHPDRDDWMKLRRVMRYLRKTVDLVLTLEAGTFDVYRLIQWWVDASYAVHEDLKSHTRAFMTLGKGTIYACSSKQKINTKSSTEAELVGVDDIMGQAMWTLNFIEAQGYAVDDNLVYQDNQSAILLENNGRASSSKRTKHLNVRYFYITDCVKRRLAKVEYCPTEEMIGDFFTKPLQGRLFRKFRNLIMNIRDDDPCNDDLAPLDRAMVDNTLDNRSVLDESPGKPTDEVRTAPPEPQDEWCEVVHKNKRRKQQ